MSLYTKGRPLKIIKHVLSLCVVNYSFVLMVLSVCTHTKVGGRLMSLSLSLSLSLCMVLYFRGTRLLSMATVTYLTEASTECKATPNYTDLPHAYNDGDDQNDVQMTYVPPHACHIHDDEHKDDVDADTRHVSGGDDTHHNEMADVRQTYPHKGNARHRTGKVQIRRIEDTASRQATFSKRRSGLLKKALELSVLCDVHLAVIIFSASGKLFEFANPNMEKVIEKYQHFSSISKNSTKVTNDLEYWRYQALQYKETLGHLETQLRHLVGENLLGLHIKDLEKLENQIQCGLNHVRETKNRLLMEKAQEHKGKEFLLQQENQMLRSKLIEAAANKPQYVSIHSANIQGVKCSSSERLCSISSQSTLQQEDKSRGGITKPNLKVGQ